jgi:hypothetical protein
VKGLLKNKYAQYPICHGMKLWQNRRMQLIGGGLSILAKNGFKVKYMQPTVAEKEA